MKLQIDLQEVARYLGYGQREVEGDTLQMIHEVTEALQKMATPRVTHQLFPLDGTRLVGTNLTLEGADIAQLLQDCHQCILLAATLGQGVDGLIRRLQITDLTRGVIADVCASSMIENFCNQVNQGLEQRWTEQGCYLTSRYSPGYGDMPLATQTPLCGLLNTTKTLGLTPTSAHILIPRKSITAIIGISRTPQQKRGENCEVCSMRERCQFRKGGTTCA